MECSGAISSRYSHADAQPCTSYILISLTHIGEVVQWVRTLATKTDHLNLIPGSQMMHGENQLPTVDLRPSQVYHSPCYLPPCMHTCARTHTYTQHTNVIKKYLKKIVPKVIQCQISKIIHCSLSFQQRFTVYGVLNALF